MNIREVAVMHLGGYRAQSNILVIKECPYCKDKGYNFEYNTVTGSTVCNKCLDMGNLDNLGKKLKVGEIIPEQFNAIVWDKESVSNTEPSRELLKILEPICSASTLERNNINFSKDGEIIYFMHLTAEGAFKGVKSISTKNDMEYRADCLNSLWNCENVNDDEVILTTSEVEVLALLEQGVTNVIGMADNKNLFFIEEYYEYLSEKKKIVVLANKEYLEKFELDLTHRLGRHKTMVIPLVHKNVIEEMFKTGSELVGKLKDIAKLETKIQNVIDISDVEGNPYDDIVIGSGEKYIDALLGGVRMGEVTVVTGFPSSGKSTILNQMVVSFREEGERSFVFSGEFKTSILKNKLYGVSAGKSNLSLVENKFNPKIKDRVIKDPMVLKGINEWFRGYVQIFEYDITARDKDLLKAIEEEYRKKGTRIFLIDNIMTVGMSVDDGGMNTAQKNFMVALKHLTKKYPIHIFLVAHPKKVPEHEIDMFSIHGASEIANLADNILLIRRLGEKEVAEFSKANGENATAEMRILKDRFYGRIGAKTYLDYDIASGRVYKVGDTPNKVYSWRAVC